MTEAHKLSYRRSLRGGVRGCHHEWQRCEEREARVPDATNRTLGEWDITAENNTEEIGMYKSVLEASFAVCLGEDAGDRGG